MENERGLERWREGGKGKHRCEKRMKTYYVQVLTLHTDCNHYVVQTCTVKAEKKPCLTSQITSGDPVIYSIVVCVSVLYSLYVQRFNIHPLDCFVLFEL